MINFSSNLNTRIKEVTSRIEEACKRSGRSPDEVTLVAVTKNVPPEVIIEAYHLGIKNIGENRIQEAQAKFKALTFLTPRPVFHLVGHLQSNKVKQALKLFDIIQSVDSLRLAEMLNSHSQGILPVFLEINIDGESTKFGFKPEEIEGVCKQISSLEKLEVRGLMTVAPAVSKPEDARPHFKRMKSLSLSLGLKDLSMGMSDDYEVAVEEGATIIRIGRFLFGERRM